MVKWHRKYQYFFYEPYYLVHCLLLQRHLFHAIWAVRARGTTLYTDLCSLLQYVEFVDLEEGSPVAVVLHDELKVTGSDQKCNVFLGHVNVAPLTSWEDMDGKVLAIFKVRRGNGYRREEGEARVRKERSEKGECAVVGEECMKKGGTGYTKQGHRKKSSSRRETEDVEAEGGEWRE